MAEETISITVSVPVTSSNAEIESSQAGTETKAQDATTEGHTSGHAGEGTADEVAAEGMSIVLRPLVSPCS